MIYKAQSDVMLLIAEEEMNETRCKSPSPFCDRWNTESNLELILLSLAIRPIFVRKEYISFFYFVPIRTDQGKAIVKVL